MSRLALGASLSERLAETLETAIRKGKLATGQKLPTENALDEKYGVSRTVVREAFSRLKTLDLIETRQGSGAFVKALPVAETGKLKLILDGSVDAVVSGIGTAIILKVIDLTVGLRVSEEVEREGLDLGEHGERAYNY